MEEKKSIEEFEFLKRTENLIGTEKLEKIKKSKVIVYGIGGVGSFVVEGLVRAGIGSIVLVDNDTVDISNINRQIHANINTVGRKKTEMMAERIKEINPYIKIRTYNADELNVDESELIDNTFSYVVDAVDTVKTKLKLIEKAKKINIPIISSMGTGNKIDPTKFEIDYIEKTSICPLARIIRKELKKRNIKKVKVLYSKEEPYKVEAQEKSPASISFVPSVAGLIIAAEVIKDIIRDV